MAIDINTWYGLTNAGIGSSSAMDVVNQTQDNNAGTVHLAAKEDVSGQYWHIAKQANGKYHLTTLYLGESKLLGVFTQGNNAQVHLTAAASNAGQSWTLVSQGDGTYKLSSDYTGTSEFLDYCADIKALCMQGGDNPGQHWTLTKIKKIPSSDAAYYSTTAGVSISLSSPSATMAPLESISYFPATYT